MLFNSFVYFLFLAIVLLVYHNSNHKIQNRLLLVASYIFYGSWDWRFLFLILLSTIVDYFVGLRVHEGENDKVKKRYVALSVIVNLSILGFFKYFNFFSGSMAELLIQFGIQPSWTLLEIILPVGISFYTFQTISYSIDVYRKQLKPTRGFLDFALFVSFFPQLVAGPIERAKSLLPQIISTRKLKAVQIKEGLWLILWGLFKKIVIADNVAVIVNTAFTRSDTLTGPEVVIAAYAFAVQIYCDFSAYSDIARGTAKLLGFELMLNFRLPFFASSPADFWRRWHISLSSWLRDYLYIPLGGSKKGSFNTYRNLLTTMLLGGLWHGAGWTFVIWGGYQGGILVLHRLTKNLFPGIKINAGLSLIIKIAFTFQLMAIGWLIFRAESFQQLNEMLLALISDWSSVGYAMSMLVELIGLTWPLMIMQAIQYWKDDLVPLFNWSVVSITALYSFLVYMIFVYGAMQSEQFIYFQF